MALNQQIQFVHQDKIEPNQNVAQVAAFDADGNPVDPIGGGDTPTTIPQGALTAGTGITATRGEDGVITVGVKPKGITVNELADRAVEPVKIKQASLTADLFAAGVLPAAYKLPAATATTLGGVKQGAAVPDLAADADTTDANAKINALLAQLRAAGVIAA